MFNVRWGKKKETDEKLETAVKKHKESADRLTSVIREARHEKVVQIVRELIPERT